MIQKLRAYDSRVEWFTFILISIFSYSSWICATSIWAQLPLILIETQESWRLPSILTLIAQIGQLFPIVIYPLLKFLIPKNVMKNNRVIFVKFVFELITLLALVFFWNKSLFIFGENRSIGLYILNLLLSIFDGMSTVSYLPFINEYFEKDYIVPYYIGEALASLIPSSLAFFQLIKQKEKKCHTTEKIIANVSVYIQEPIKPKSKFSISLFFTIIAIFFLMSFISFLILLKRNQPKNQELERQSKEEKKSFLNEISSTNDFKKKIEIFYLLILTFFNSFILYGLLLGLQSYSTLAYSDLAFNLSINLGNVLLPFVILCSICFYQSNLIIITFEFLIALFFSLYIVVISFYSPCPPLVDHWSGDLLIVFAWIISECILLRLRLVIASRLEKYEEKITFIYGWITLVGQMLGGLTIYIMVDVYRIFKSKPHCVNDFSYCH